MWRFYENLHNFWKSSASFCRSWKMLKNPALIVKIGVDTAENEPLKDWYVDWYSQWPFSDALSIIVIDVDADEQEEAELIFALLFTESNRSGSLHFHFASRFGHPASWREATDPDPATVAEPADRQLTYHSFRGSFSAVSTPIFTIKYSFCSILRDLQNELAESSKFC